jgi:hypothetical protein
MGVGFLLSLTLLSFTPLCHCNKTPHRYGDRTDTMGWGWAGFAQSFNSIHRSILGMLPDSHIRDFTTNPPSGCLSTHTLIPLHLNPANHTGIQVVRLSRSAVRDGGMYWISYRASVAYDAGLVDKGLGDKVHIHRSRTGGIVNQYADSYIVRVLLRSTLFECSISCLTSFRSDSALSPQYLFVQRDCERVFSAAVLACLESAYGTHAANESNAWGAFESSGCSVVF